MRYLLRDKKNVLHNNITGIILCCFHLSIHLYWLNFNMTHRKAKLQFRNAYSVVITVKWLYSEILGRQQHKTSSPIQVKGSKTVQIVACDKTSGSSSKRLRSCMPSSAVTQVVIGLFWTTMSAQGKWDDRVVGQWTAMEQASLHRASTSNEATDAGPVAGTTTSNRCRSR